METYTLSGLHISTFTGGDLGMKYRIPCRSPQALRATSMVDENECMDSLSVGLTSVTTFLLKDDHLVDRVQDRRPLRQEPPGAQRCARARSGFLYKRRATLSPYRNQARRGQFSTPPGL